jgi:hypothetical protein
MSGSFGTPDKPACFAFYSPSKSKCSYGAEEKRVIIFDVVIFTFWTYFIRRIPECLPERNYSTICKIISDSMMMPAYMTVSTHDISDLNNR